VCVCVCVCLTCLGGAVDVLYGEGGAQAVEQHLGQRWDQLGGGHQHVHTVGPGERWGGITRLGLKTRRGLVAVLTADSYFGWMDV